MVIHFKLWSLWNMYDSIACAKRGPPPVAGNFASLREKGVVLLLQNENIVSIIEQRINIDYFCSGLVWRIQIMVLKAFMQIWLVLYCWHPSVYSQYIFVPLELLTIWNMAFGRDLAWLLWVVFFCVLILYGAILLWGKCPLLISSELLIIHKYHSVMFACFLPGFI